MWMLHYPNRPEEFTTECTICHVKLCRLLNNMKIKQCSNWKCKIVISNNTWVVILLLAFRSSFFACATITFDTQNPYRFSLCLAWAENKQNMKNNDRIIYYLSPRKYHVLIIRTIRFRWWYLYRCTSGTIYTHILLSKIQVIQGGFRECSLQFAVCQEIKVQLCLQYKTRFIPFICAIFDITLLIGDYIPA